MSISLDSEDKLECSHCENNLLTITDVETIKDERGINKVIIKFCCVTCNETIHSLNMANKTGSTNISWKRQDNLYASAVKNMFKS
jgi:hypothetical protein